MSMFTVWNLNICYLEINSKYLLELLVSMPCTITTLYAQFCIYFTSNSTVLSLQWRHDEHDGISNHQPHDCLLNCLLRHRSKKTSKLHVTGLCDRWPVNSPHKGPVMQKMYLFDDVIMYRENVKASHYSSSVWWSYQMGWLHHTVLWKGLLGRQHFTHY